MSAEVYVAGIRSFAAEVIDYARDAGLSVAGLLAPAGDGSAHDPVHGLPVYGIDDDPGGSRRVIVGTGDPARREIVARLESAGWRPFTLVHPRAHLAPSARVGDGVLVAPGVIVGAYSTLGDHVVLGRGTLVGHHTDIGPFATLGPGANVAGNTRVGPDAFLGAGAVVRDHVTIGVSAVVGMGAVVVGDVAPETHARGVPAREVPIRELAEPH
jgi:sugar O-acyltransferase (sialic acid O-acetyltransferase NeuD family)